MYKNFHWSLNDSEIPKTLTPCVKKLWFYCPKTLKKYFVEPVKIVKFIQNPEKTFYDSGDQLETTPLE